MKAKYTLTPTKISATILPTKGFNDIVLMEEGIRRLRFKAPKSTNIHTLDISRTLISEVCLTGVNIVNILVNPGTKVFGAEVTIKFPISDGLDYLTVNKLRIPSVIYTFMTYYGICIGNLDERQTSILRTVCLLYSQYSSKISKDVISSVIKSAFNNLSPDDKVVYYSDDIINIISTIDSTNDIPEGVVSFPKYPTSNFYLSHCQCEIIRDNNLIVSVVWSNCNDMETHNIEAYVYTKLGQLACIMRNGELHYLAQYKLPNQTTVTTLFNNVGELTKILEIVSN